MLCFSGFIRKGDLLIMKRFLAVLMVLAILLCGLTVTAFAETGWVEKNGLWYYYKADGTMVTNDWVKTGGNWFYLDEDGVMAADEVISWKDSWYALKKNGAMVTNDWFSRSIVLANKTYTEWYYAGSDGALATGWKQIGKKWYYFFDFDFLEDEPPYMIDGEVIEPDEGKRYAFKPGGEMIVGWGQPRLGSQWYDQDKPYVKRWVYANADGSLAIGWKKIDGKWYYFSQYGWMFQDGDTQTLDGLAWIDGKWYAFDKSGAMLADKWYEFKWASEEESGSDWLYMGADGSAKTGWFKAGGRWYYADEYGWVYHNGFIEMSDGKTYYLDPDTCAMATGWNQIGDDWYYFSGAGARAEKEWVMSGGKWYYLKEGGVMAKSEMLTIDGKDYTFGADGAWVK